MQQLYIVHNINNTYLSNIFIYIIYIYIYNMYSFIHITLLEFSIQMTTETWVTLESLRHKLRLEEIQDITDKKNNIVSFFSEVKSMWACYIKQIPPASIHSSFSFILVSELLFEQCLCSTACALADVWVILTLWSVLSFIWDKKIYC